MELYYIRFTLVLFFFFIFYGKEDFLCSIWFLFSSDYLIYVAGIIERIAISEDDRY